MTHNATLAAAKGTVTINDTTAKTGSFKGISVEDSTTVFDHINDENGNDVKSELITTPGSSIASGSWITPHPKHGVFTSVKLSTAGQVTCVKS